VTLAGESSFQLGLFYILRRLFLVAGPSSRDFA
jgi:hypothetical protein